MIVKYLSEKIISGDLDYTFAVEKRPDLELLINEYLVKRGFENLIENKGGKLK